MSTISMKAAMKEAEATLNQLRGVKQPDDAVRDAIAKLEQAVGLIRGSCPQMQIVVSDH